MGDQSVEAGVVIVSTSSLQTLSSADSGFPQLLKEWRQRRRLSQLDLALSSGVSQRHVSFLESGRANPSRNMILQLSETLDVPLRERNAWLTAAGFAPLFQARPMDDPQMSHRRRTADRNPVPGGRRDRSLVPQRRIRRRPIQEAAFRTRIASDMRRLELLGAVRRRLAGGEALSVDDLIHLTRDTAMGISKTHDAFALESEAMAVIQAAGLYPLMVDVPAETNENHWHDFDSIIFILEGEFVMTDSASGETLACGPGSRIDFPRGILHHEDHRGYRALVGFSVDPATFKGPLNMPPEAWAG